MATVTAQRTIRVLVVDDHPLFRQGVASVFEAEETVEIVGMVGSARDAAGEVARLSPDVVLVDLNLGDGSGIDVCADIQEYPTRARLVVVTRSAAPQYVVKAFESGVAGYVVKTTDPADILHAVRAVACDGTYIDPSVAGALVRLALKGRDRGRPFGLTRQEMAVLEAAATGLSVEQVAERLGMTAPTVETHLVHAMRKLGVDDPHQAAQILHRQRNL